MKQNVKMKQDFEKKLICISLRVMSLNIADKLSTSNKLLKPEIRDTKVLK